MPSDKRKKAEYGIITIITVMVFICLMFLLLGFRLTDDNAYNTYALQADSWRQGRLDLGQDYPWLELAIMDGKYYCSFPPFPSYVLFPFTFFFGNRTPDYIIMVLADALTVLYLYKLAITLGVKEEGAMLLTIFVTIGANTLFVMVNPSVWFMAQLFCFATSVIAIYYAVIGKGSLALFFWAASVGCRPMQILFLPVLLLLLFGHERRNDAETAAVRLIIRRLCRAVPMGIVAGSYMLLNYFRFGNILEFGHNYLPEFVRAEKGQFHIDYVRNNMISLLHLPEFAEDGKLLINHFGNLNFMIICPIVVMMLFGMGYAIGRKDKQLLLIGVPVLVLSAAYLFVVTMHRTMGAWQFGNRYAIDILPYVFLCLSMLAAKYPAFIRYSVPLCMLGIGLNTVGTVIVYNGLS